MIKVPSFRDQLNIVPSGSSDEGGLRKCASSFTLYEQRSSHSLVNTSASTDRLFALLSRQKRNGALQEAGKGNSKAKHRPSSIEVPMVTQEPEPDQANVSQATGHSLLKDSPDGWTNSGKHFKVGDFVLNSQDFSKLASKDHTQWVHSQSVSNLSDTSCEFGQIQRSKLRQVGVLGRGSFGLVMLVKHRETGDHYAVKSIPANSDIMQSLKQELSAFELLVHPNLVRTVSAFAKSNMVHVVQEYMDKGSLINIMTHAGNFSESLAFNVAHQVLSGLNFMHGGGSSTDVSKVIIHRDLKPQNVLANRLGEIKICDYGIMSIADPNGVTTWCGTCRYMSPERIQGNRYNEKSDIWALGLTIHEITLGHLPFKSSVNSYIELLMEVTTGVINLSDKLSAEMKEFLALCLAKDKDQRPSAGDLLRLPIFEKIDRSKKVIAEFISNVPSGVLQKDKVRESEKPSWGSSICGSDNFDLLSN